MESYGQRGEGWRDKVKGEKGGGSNLRSERGGGGLRSEGRRVEG